MRWPSAEALRAFGPYLVLAGLVLPAAGALFAKGMIGVGDHSPFPESVGQAWSTIQDAWKPLVLGLKGTPIDPSVFIKIGFLVLAGGNAALAQKFYMIAPLLLAALGMCRFLGMIGLGPVPRILGAVVYTMNPAVIATFLGGAIGWLYVHAFLPIVVMALLHTVDTTRSFATRVRWSLLFGVAFVVGFNLGMHLALLFAPFLLYVILRELNARGLRQALRAFLPMGTGFAVAGVLWILVYLPQLAFWGAYVVPGGASESAHPVLGISYDLYREIPAPLLTILALQPPDAIGWGPQRLLTALGLALPLLAFGALLVVPRAERQRAWLFASAAAGITAFGYFTSTGHLLFLFYWFRFLVVLPNPDILQLYLGFMYAPLVGLTFHHLGSRKVSRPAATVPVAKGPIWRLVRIRNPARAIVGIGFACAFLLTSWPMATGSLGLLIVRSDAWQAPPPESDAFLPWLQDTLAKKASIEAADTKTFIPAHYYEIRDRIRAMRGPDVFARTVWLPTTRSETEIKLLYMDVNPLIIPLGLERWFVPELVHYQRDVYRQVFEQGTSRTLGTQLAPLSVRFVILNLASPHTGPPLVYYRQFAYNNQVIGDPKIIAQILEDQRDLRLVVEAPLYRIYENLAYVPSLYVYDRIVEIRSSDPDATSASILKDFSWISPTRTAVVIARPSGLPELAGVPAVRIDAQPASEGPRDVGAATDTIYARSMPAGDGVGTILLEVRETGEYRVAFRRSANVSIDGGPPLPLAPVRDDLYESSPMALLAGSHTLRVVVAERNGTGDPTLAASWSFREAQSPVRDRSGNGNEATVVGDVGWGERQWRRAAWFNKTGSLEVPDSPSLRFDGGSFTVEGWLLLDQTDDAPVIRKGTTTWWGIIAVGDKLRFYSGDGALASYVPSAGNLQTGEWFHFAAVYDGPNDTARVFLNGVAGDPEPMANPVKDAPASMQMFQRVAGSVHEIRVWRRALSDREVRETFFAGELQRGSVLVYPSGATRSIEDIIPSDGDAPQIAIERATASERSLTRSARGHGLLFLGEVFDRDWVGRDGTGRLLPHVSVFGHLNGFLLAPEDGLHLVLAYEPQAVRDRLLVVGAGVIVAILGLYVTAPWLEVRFHRILRHVRPAREEGVE